LLFEECLTVIDIKAKDINRVPLPYTGEREKKAEILTHKEVFR
jgi:hypothetical protein